MSTTFIRRGIVSAGRLATPPPPPSIYQPVGTQHVWWATDLVGTYDYGDLVTSWEDSVNALTFTGAGSIVGGDVLTNTGFNSKAAIIPDEGSFSLMAANVDSLTYTNGSIFVLPGFGNYFYNSFKVRLYIYPFTAPYIELIVNPSTTNWIFNLYGETGGEFYSFSAAVPRTSLYCFIEINSSSGSLSIKLNGSNLSLTPGGSYTLSVLDGIWFNDVNRFAVETYSDYVNRWAGYPFVIVTDEEPTDRADLQTWATDYYGITLG